MSNLSPTMPHANKSHARHQPYYHKHKPGDEVCYFSEDARNRVRSFLFAHVKIIEVGFDKNRNPRYKVERIKQVRVNRGKPSTEGIKNNKTPAAYHLDKNDFDPSEWDEMVQRKINLTKAKPYG